MFVANTWNGPTKFCIRKALRHARVTHNQFFRFWKAKVHSCRTSVTGAQELSELLERGLGKCDCKTERLERQIWFINQIVGSNAPEPETTTTQKVCKHVWLYGYICSLFYHLSGFRITRLSFRSNSCEQ